MFQWILFLGAYLKRKPAEGDKKIKVSVDTIPWGLLKVKRKLRKIYQKLVSVDTIP